MTRLAPLALAALALVACETVPPCEPHDSDKCRVEALERRVEAMQMRMLGESFSRGFSEGYQRSQMLHMQNRLNQLQMQQQPWYLR